MNANFLFLSGFAGKKPQFFEHQDIERRMCSFTIATHSYYPNGKGEFITHTDWHYIRVYGRLAQYCFDQIETGMPVVVMGSLKSKTVTEPKPKSVVYVKANQVKILKAAAAGAKKEAVEIVDEIDFEADAATSQFLKEEATLF